MSLGPNVIVEQSDIQYKVFRVLDKADPKYQDILKRRFGLVGYHEHTYKEIGLMYDISRERVRQAIERTLSFLRKHY